MRTPVHRACGLVQDGIKVALCGARFWICDQSSVGDMPLFEPQLSSEYAVPRPFPLLTPAPVSRLGDTGCWEGDIARTADPAGDSPLLIMSAQQHSCVLLLLLPW